ncbi:MAG: ATP-binding protein [Anaerolineae bacterium]|jgi:signal transduction histidine kinase
MLRTLRARFVLSHVLPLAIIIPVMGIALIYVLETRVLLGVLSQELEAEARLAAKIAADRPEIWHDPEQAQTYAVEVETDVGTRVILLDTQGTLLASSDPTDAERLGDSMQLDGWTTALAGETSVRAVYSRQMEQEVVDALAPVLDQDQQVVGVVRLSHRMTNIYDQFMRQRFLVGGILIIGLLLGTGAGLVLALSLERPLREVTRAVDQAASGGQLAPIPERGPLEIQHLLHSVNVFVERLQTLEQARRQLLANLVHELGRPLGAFRSATQALLGRSGEDAALRRELLVGMDEEVDRLSHLLDDLSGLHDQVLGTLELHRRPVPLSEWLTHTLPPWREAAQAKGLTWKASIPASLPTANVDTDRLAQVLGNLLSNAIKYTLPRGTVTVSAGVEKEEVWIRVSDTGPGISAEEQERIFAPFYRSQPGRRFPQGMGLGLSIAYALVAAHGGRLDLESSPGLGSQFTVWLPLNDREL